MGLAAGLALGYGAAVAGGLAGAGLLAVEAQDFVDVDHCDFGVGELLGAAVV